MVAALYFSAPLLSRIKQRDSAPSAELKTFSAPSSTSSLWYFFLHAPPPSFLSLKSSRWGRDAMAANDFFELQAFLKVTDSLPLPIPLTKTHPPLPIDFSPCCSPSLARIHICIRPHTVFSFASICFYRVVWSEYWRTSLKKPAQPRFPAHRADT